MKPELPDISELDLLLRSGRAVEVRRRLLNVTVSALAREQLADWSNLARRAGLYTLALRILQPILRVKKDLGRAATPKERAVYAASLAAIGALSEAFGVLKGLEAQAQPEVQLFYGFAHVYAWNYAAAAPFFARYAELEGPSEFQKALARVNLAAARCFLRDYNGVLELTERLIPEAESHGWVVLRGEANLLAGQALLNLGRFQESAAAIERAHQLSGSSTSSLLHAEKWRLFLALTQMGPKPEVLARLETLKADAGVAKSWEIVRDCDYHVGLHTRQRRVLERVYFGTPFWSYRERLLSAAAACSSPVRVKTALSRTRAWLKSSNIPIEILCHKQDYYLSSREAWALRVRLVYAAPPAGPKLPLDDLKRLREAWPHKSFSSQQAAEVLDISTLRAQRLLKTAADAKKVYKSGVGRSRVYRFRK